MALCCRQSAASATQAPSDVAVIGGQGRGRFSQVLRRYRDDAHAAAVHPHGDGVPLDLYFTAFSSHLFNADTTNRASTGVKCMSDTQVRIDADTLEQCAWTDQSKTKHTLDLSNKTNDNVLVEQVLQACMRAKNLYCLYQHSSGSYQAMLPKKVNKRKSVKSEPRPRKSRPPTCCPSTTKRSSRPSWISQNVYTRTT